MFNVSFCAVIAHKQINLVQKSRLSVDAIQQVELAQKGKKDFGLIDVLEFTEAELDVWQKQSKGLDALRKKHLALRLYEEFKLRQNGARKH